MKTESEVLVEVIQSTRELLLYYLDKVKNTDIYNEFAFDDKKLNSVYWITGHLAWSEHFLLLSVTGGDYPAPAWLNAFKLGTPLDKTISLPAYEEITQTLHQIHALAKQHVINLTSDQLDAPNKFNLRFGPSDSVRSIIHHHIRHEGIHTGHLGWIAKLNGIKTI